MYTIHDLAQELQLPAASSSLGVWVYAPTSLPPGGSCIEATQVYRRRYRGATTGKLFGLWDWCQSGADGEFDVLEAQTTSWTQRYVRTYQGMPTYAIVIVTPNTGNTWGQCWYANLYDYILGGWVQKLAKCGIPGHNGQRAGWSMWESWYLFPPYTGGCPKLPGIRALDIAFADPSTSSFVPFTDNPLDFWPLGPYGSCWISGSYQFVFPAPGVSPNSWRANTPNP